MSTPDTSKSLRAAIVLIAREQKLTSIRDLLDRAPQEYSQDGEDFARFLTDLRGLLDR